MPFVIMAVVFPADLIYEPVVIEGKMNVWHNSLSG